MYKMNLLHLVARRSVTPATAAAALSLTRQFSVFVASNTGSNAAQHNCPGTHASSSSSRGGGSSSWLPSSAAAVALAAAGVAWGLASPAPASALTTAGQDSSSEGYSSSSDSDSSDSSSDAAKRASFAAWLSSNGSDLSAVAVQPCTDQGAGLGLFALPGINQHIKHSWLGTWLGSLVLRGADNQTVTVATFPFNLSLTVETALSHPQLGEQFAELLQLGLLDERSAVVLLLLVERARDDDSPWAPYLQLLPESFDSPLFYSDAQLQELSGTTLAAATAARRAALLRDWQRLQPAVGQMLQQVGVAANPTFEDFLWATSAFWSRALTLPVTHTDAAMPAAVVGSSDGSSGSNGSSDGGSSDGSGVLRFKVLEGMVPGLDFANHSTQPKCWWEVEQLSDASQQPQQSLPGAAGAQHVVKLMANRACCPKPGEELTISYGDKGNEELLLLYGFAQPQNPHETLMVCCPVPDPQEWDGAFTARMQLLQAKGLRPQLFLSTSHYEAATGKPLLLSPTAPVPESRDAAANGSNAAADSSGGSKRRADAKRHCSIVPEAAREVLEVFVLDKRELAAALQAQQQQQQQHSLLPTGGSNSSSNSNSNSRSEVDPVQDRVQQLGLDMAVLTTFSRLLELKMLEMEGDGGTGSLEADLQQLADAAVNLNTTSRVSSSSNSGSTASFPAWRRYCLLYRAGQKALVRSYITAARAELQETLAELQALIGSDG